MERHVMIPKESKYYKDVEGKQLKNGLTTMTEIHLNFTDGSTITIPKSELNEEKVVTS